VGIPEIDREIQKLIQKREKYAKDGARVEYSPDGEAGVKIERHLTEKMDYAHRLERQIENCQFCAMYSYEAFGRSVILLLNMIPEKDQDEQFKEELEQSTVKEKIPTGRYKGFGGMTREVIEERKDYDYFSLFRAIVNLLRRRGMMWGEVDVEQFW